MGTVPAKHADPKSRLHTDESRLYPENAGRFAAHETGLHSRGECARGPKGPDRIHTNSVEGFFGILAQELEVVPSCDYVDTKSQ